MAKERGWWTLDVGDCEPDEYDLEHIGELIKEGYTSGEICETEDEKDDEDLNSEEFADKYYNGE